MPAHIQVINKAEDYIEAHLGEAIRLKVVADSLHLSQFHFHRLFRRHTQESFHQFVSRLKMERSAVYLLVRPQVSITEVALQYGYAEASSYNRAFRRHWRMTPSEFRESKKSQS